MYQLYYQPEGIWVGDIMPYGKEGQFYVYHQRDTRNPGPFGEPFGWALATTKDFVDYKDYGESLKRGTDEEADQFIYAGSVFETEAGFHAFYTGYNREFLKAGKTSQTLLHATSTDGITWEKSKEALEIPPQEGYDKRNWRDPFVLWDEEREEYLLILGARKGEDKRKQTGRLVHFTFPSVSLVATSFLSESLIVNRTPFKTFPLESFFFSLMLPLIIWFRKVASPVIFADALLSSGPMSNVTVPAF